MAPKPTNGKYKPGKFAIDAAGPFSGYYIPGWTWNGWECPAFGRVVAERVIRRFFKRWKYDPKTDMFLGFNTDYNEWEDWKGRDITVAGKKIHVYHIGTQSWTWDLV